MDRLWDTPAYRLLQDKEGRRRDLSAAFRLAFDPARAADADSAEAAGGWTAFVLPHLREVTLHRDELRAYERTLSDSALYEGARRLAQKYLPAGSTTAAPAPNVAFAYFVDARGYRESLLLDPLYLMRITNPTELLAHEFHHTIGPESQLHRARSATISSPGRCRRRSPRESRGCSTRPMSRA